MPHTFSLQAVLQLRQHKEDAEERALAALGVQRQQLQTTLNRVQQQLRQWTDERAREAGSLGTGATQLSNFARLNFLKESLNQLEERLQELQRRTVEQQAVYLAARRARAMLTELKEQELCKRREVEARQEQRRAEDLFLGRWSR